MKIKKSGSKKKAKKSLWWIGKEMECENCGCEFQLEMGDKVEDASRNCFEQHWKVRCPECSQYIQFPDKDNLDIPLIP